LDENFCPEITGAAPALALELDLPHIAQAGSTSQVSGGYRIKDSPLREETYRRLYMRKRGRICGPGRPWSCICRRS